jgi:hypothetical protein
MRRDVCKCSFDVLTDQIKIERRKGAARAAGTAVYQVVGAVINADIINYFYLFSGTLYQLHKLYGVKWKGDYEL